MASTAAVGVFDSGVGGLTVAAAILARMPAEDLLYFGDTARVPYGIKSPETIRRFSHEISRWLLRQGVKAIVIACNTASAVALEELQRTLPVPVIGVVEAGARQALAASSSRAIAVIGTASTIASRAYPRCIEALDPAARTLSRACPLFVPLVEDGLVEGPLAAAAVRHYLADLQGSGVDTLLLGCTHYPLLREAIAAELGPQLQIVDAAEGTAAALAELLAARGLANPALGRGRARFVFSDATEAFQRLMRRILPDFVGDMERIDVESAAFRGDAPTIL
jgi:glutamate racemase